MGYSNLAVTVFESVLINLSLDSSYNCLGSKDFEFEGNHCLLGILSVSIHVDINSKQNLWGSWKLEGNAIWEMTNDCVLVCCFGAFIIKQ